MTANHGNIRVATADITSYDSKGEGKAQLSPGPRQSFVGMVCQVSFHLLGSP